jgi:hypothetical protein
MNIIGGLPQKRPRSRFRAKASMPTGQPGCVVVVEPGAVVVVVDDVVLDVDTVVVDVVEPDGLLVVVDPPEPVFDELVVVVVEVVVDGVLETGTTPHGPAPPVRCGTAKGLVGLPGWVAPRPRMRSSTAATAPPVRSEPTAAGRSTATSRSRADSL